jgi:hypothetical protein
LAKPNESVLSRATVYSDQQRSWSLLVLFVFFNQDCFLNQDLASNFLFRFSLQILYDQLFSRTVTMAQKSSGLPVPQYAPQSGRGIDLKSAVRVRVRVAKLRGDVVEGDEGGQGQGGQQVEHKQQQPQQKN